MNQSCKLDEFQHICLFGHIEPTTRRDRYFTYSPDCLWRETDDAAKAQAIVPGWLQGHWVTQRFDPRHGYWATRKSLECPLP